MTRTYTSRRRNCMKHLAPLLFLFLLIIFSLNLQAEYEQDTVFMADFQNPSLEDWSTMLGEWDIDEGHYCTITCSS